MRHRRVARLGWATAPLALLGLMLHTAGVAVLSVVGPLPVPEGPGWVPLGLPAATYAIVAVLAVHRFAIVPIAGTFAAAGALHAALVVLPVPVTPWLASLDALGGVTAPAWTSVELAVLTVLSVILTLAPFRPLVAPRPRYARVTARPGTSKTRLSRPVAASAAVRAGHTARPTGETRPADVMATPVAAPPATGRASVAVAPPASSSARPSPPPVPLPAPSPVVASAPPSPAPSPRRPAAPAPASPPAPRAAESNAATAGGHRDAQPGEEMIRIAFDRVADQLPPELFRLAPDRLGASLLEPGILLVPRNVVWPQLAEGLVLVPWRVIAGQFSPQALAVPAGEVAARIANGQIVLPLDEVIRQLPVELFTLTTPEVDVRGIDDFPPPFQPHVPPPSAPQAEPLLDAAPLASSSSETDPLDGEVSFEPGPVEASRVEYEEPEPARGVVDIDEGLEEPGPAEGSSWDEDPLRPEPVGEEAATTEEPAWAVLTDADEAPEPAGDADLPLDDPVPDEPDPMTPVEAHAPAVEPEPAAHRDTPALPRTAPAESTRVRVRSIAALLGPLMTSLETGSVAHGGRTLLTALPPAMDEAAAVGTGLRVLPFLTDSRLPSPATQATLRTASGALVLTPLTPGDPDGAVLLTATPLGASLALLERLSLRAARDWQAEHGVARPARGDPRVHDDSGLTPTPVPPHVHAMAESLGAFGAVSPAVLSDASGALVVYLFLPRGVDPMALGALARDLTRALQPVPLGPVESVMLRAVADGRLVVRSLPAPEHATVLVAGGGPVDRPGLARIELDRAAARLGPARA